ncbi:phenylacetate--CoA ligase family protein [Candidatus Entotheonella palauensis]|nr:phenylacetate--CoA ligase family protein [Candidatus Entotheonella palauensis]
MMTYFDQVDHAQLLRDFPIADAFRATFTMISRDELYARQNDRFMRLMQRVWQIPFYQRLYAQHGLEPGDIRHLEDIDNLPVYSKTDLMQSIEAHPPYGDFHGMETSDARAILHTTSGTTGTPQVLLFGPKSREIQNLLLARAYLFQGLRKTDVVHSVYGFGMINGGHYIRETLLHWTQAMLLPAGTGVETSSRQQVVLMRDFGATCLVGFADYLKRLADVARELGIIPGEHIPMRMLSGHLGREDRRALCDAWGGAEAYDWYGVGDTGIIASEGSDHNGLYVWEDAHYLELLDVDTAAPVADGLPGDMVVTVLFKDDIYPIVRFNTHDVSAFETSSSSLDLKLRRIRGFLGRSDNMVKLRGINIFPQAIGPLLDVRPEFTGEYICRAERDSTGRDQLTVMIEITTAPEAYAHLAPVYRELLKTKLGITVDVELTSPGALSHLTGIETRQKPVRLLDTRLA